MNARSITHIALYAALIAVLGLLPKFSIPVAGGVPITAQTLGVMLAGVMLGPVRGFLACMLFLFVVALGLPLLAGGRGGLGVFFAPSVGFLVGWPLGAFVAGVLMKSLIRMPVFAAAVVAAFVGGIGVVYLIGIPALAMMTDLTLGAAAIGSAAFLPGDIIKVVLCALIAKSIAQFQPDSLLSRV